MLPSNTLMVRLHTILRDHSIRSTTDICNSLRMSLPYKVIRRAHQVRLAIIHHAGWTEIHTPAIAGEKLTILPIGPELAMLFKMRFGFGGHTLGLR